MQTKKIKILHIMPQFTTGGAERMVLHYARLLNKEKFEVAIASTVEDGTLRPLFEQTSVKLFVGSRSKDGGRLGVALKLKKFVKEYQPNIIHTHLFGGDIFGWFFKVIQRNSAYWVSTQHNVEFETSFIRRCIWRYILKRANQIIAVADKVKRYDLEFFGLDEKKVMVLKNGIEIEVLGRLPEINTTNKVWQLGIVGRLNKQKGHVYLLDALAKLIQYHWNLHIFGDGENKEILLKQAQSRGINDRLIWHGVENNIARLYSSVDIIIQPSLWEGLSLVIMEALCAGRFVIASTPAGEELIKDKHTGLLVRPGNTNDIVETLQYSFQHPEEIRAIAARAHINALEHFDIHINVQNIERLYFSLMNTRG